MVRRLRLVTAAASGIPILALGAWALPAQATSSSTPFSLSGIAAQSRQPSVATTPATAGTRFASANGAAASVSVGSNINVIGTNDVVQQATINGVSVYPAIRASTPRRTRRLSPPAARRSSPVPTTIAFMSRARIATTAPGAFTSRRTGYRWQRPRLQHAQRAVRRHEREMDINRGDRGH